MILILLHDFFFKISSTIFYYSERIFPSPFSGWLIFSLSIFISPHRIINSNYTEIAVFSTKLLSIFLLFCRLFSPLKFLPNLKMVKENIFKIIYLIQIESYSKMTVTFLNESRHTYIQLKSMSKVRRDGKEKTGE